MKKILLLLLLLSGCASFASKPLIMSAEEKSYVLTHKISPNLQKTDELAFYKSANILNGVYVSSFEGLMGKPDLVRKEKDTSILGYYGVNCSLMVFSANDKYISYVAGVAKDATSYPYDACLAEIYVLRKQR